MSPPLISLENVSVRRNGRNLLEHISFSLHSGELVTLIGPNGAGKTTLVRTILGTLKPDSGTITRREGLTIGYVPQRMQVNPLLPMTVTRFLALAHTEPADEDILREAEISHLSNYPLATLSGGEMQRVLLARALLRKPDLLVLDEPVQGLDIDGQSRFYRYLDSIRTTLTCGILMVSHDLHMVMASTDQVFCINRHLCCAGHPEAIRQDPAFLSLFGPRAAETLAVYTHDHDHTHGWHHEHQHHTETPDQEHPHG